MNKTKISLLALLSALAFFNVGCVSSVGDAYSKAKKSISGNQAPEAIALYAQVPDKDKEEVAALNHELQITKERKILADLENDRDDLQQERSEYNADRLKFLAEEKTYRVHLAKLEAIDRNKLGDKITNIESITDVHLDAIKVQQKRLKLDSKVSILDVQIENIDKDVKSQENKIEQLLSDG
jgi:hypothetical protein